MPQEDTTKTIRRIDFEQACKEAIKPVLSMVAHSEAMLAGHSFVILPSGRVRYEKTEPQSLVALKKSSAELCNTMCMIILKNEFPDLLPVDPPLQQDQREQ